MREKPGLHKQLSKKASALKLKQATANTTNYAATEAAHNPAALLNSIHQQPGAQPILHQNQSLVSSQGSLHQTTSPGSNPSRSQNLSKT